MNLGLAPDTGDWLDADSVKSQLFSSQDRQVCLMQELLGVQFTPAGTGWACVDPDSLKGTPSKSDPERLLFFRFSGKSGPNRPSDVIEWVKDHFGYDYIEALKWIESWIGQGFDPSTIETIPVFQTIWQSSTSINGTSAESYLSNRQILKPSLSSLVRFNRYKSTESIVFPVTSSSGELVGVQTVSISPEGHKGPNGKLSHGSISKGFIRIGGCSKSPVLLAEGPETAASLSIATDFEVWAGVGHPRAFLNRLTNESKEFSYLVCCDRFKNADERARITEKVHELSAQGYDIAALEYPVNASGTDYNDMLREAGAEAVRQAILQDPIPTVRSPARGLEALKAMEITSQEIESFAGAKVVVPDLILSGHLSLIIAPANAGKTALLTNLAGDIAKQGYDVFYINADLAMSDAAIPKRLALRDNWRLILPDARDGDSVGAVTEILRDMTNSADDLSSVVIILDTVKKFADLQNKQAAKNVFMLLRALNARGVTVIGLGHTKKYRDESGKLVFDGVGDLKTDVDELIYIESYRRPDSNQTILTTYPDKKRAAIERASFSITWDEYRGPELERLDQIIDTRAIAVRDELIETERHVVDAIYEVLGASYQLKAGDLIEKTNTLLTEVWGCGRNRNVLSNLIRLMAKEPYPLLTLDLGISNAKLYRLADQSAAGELS